MTWAVGRCRALPVQGQDARRGVTGVSEKSGCGVGSRPMHRLFDFLFYTAVAGVACYAIALIAVSLVG
jgi:hypothetical protein